MTDAELLARFLRSNDQAAFAEIVERHAGLVVGAARRLAPQDADDVAQATFFLLARRAPKLVGRASVAGWLYETARGCARNARRGRLRHERKIAAARAESEATGATLNAEVVALLDDALARLPSPVRDVVLLRHVESLTVAETAARLNVAATTVTKRSERGLSRLRDFFAERGHAGVGAAGVATLLAAPAHVDAATLAAGATGKATPAVAALATTGVAVPMTVVAAAAAAVALVAAATVAVRPATPPKVAATAPASAPATPATRPSVEVSQESGKAAATAFLDALRAGDRAKLAAFWADGDATARDSSATATIEQIRNGPYAAFPQRLTLGGNGYFEMEPTIFNADGTTQPTSPGGPHPTGATLNAQTPTEADIGRLVLHLTVVNSQWRIANAQFVADGAVDSGRRVDLASATTLPISRELGVRAAAAWERANHAMDGSHIDDLKPENVAGFRAALVTYGEAATEFIDAVKGSPLAVRDRDASRLASLVRDLLTVIDHESIEALRRQVASVEKDATLGEAIGRIAAAAEAVSWALDAADELHPATTRPAVAGAAVPVRIAWLNDEVVRIRGPVGFPDWLKSTRAWKQWEIQHDVKTFRTRDDGGSVYAVSISGAESLPDGATRPMLNAIRRYRPDGTLAAIAEFGFGDSPQSWGEFDETGRRYTFRANVGYLDDGKTPFLRDIRFFASDGSIRDWNIWASSPGVVASESIADAIDENQEWVHLPNRAGRETIRSVVELPIDGLPLERVAP